MLVERYVRSCKLELICDMYSQLWNIGSGVPPRWLHYSNKYESCTVAFNRSNPNLLHNIICCIDSSMKPKSV